MSRNIRNNLPQGLRQVIAGIRGKKDRATEDGTIYNAFGRGVCTGKKSGADADG